MPAMTDLIMTYLTTIMSPIASDYKLHMVNKQTDEES